MMMCSPILEGNRALLSTNVARRPLLQRGLMNFQFQNFHLVPRETVNFVSRDSQGQLFKRSLDSV